MSTIIETVCVLPFVAFMICYDSQHKYKHKYTYLHTLVKPNRDGGILITYFGST